jgi:hypothetical protein
VSLNRGRKCILPEDKSDVADLVITPVPHFEQIRLGDTKIGKGIDVGSKLRDITFVAATAVRWAVDLSEYVNTYLFYGLGVGELGKGSGDLNIAGICC